MTLPLTLQLKSIVNDSKKLSLEERESLYKELTTHPKVNWSVSIIDHERIDEINILQATMEAMTKAVGQLVQQPSIVLVISLSIS